MARQTNLPPALYEAVMHVRQPDENILWTGRPNPRRVSNRAFAVYFAAVPLIALAGGFLVSTLPDAVHKPAADTLLYCAIEVFVLLLGIALLVVPYRVKQNARRTAYAISDRRILILRETWNRSVHTDTYVPTRGEEVHCTELTDGSGDLVYSHSSDSETGSAAKTLRFEFTGIRDVRAVERLIWATFFESRTATSNPAEAALARVQMHV